MNDMKSKRQKWRDITRQNKCTSHSYMSNGAYFEDKNLYKLSRRTQCPPAIGIKSLPRNVSSLVSDFLPDKCSYLSDLVNYSPLNNRSSKLLRKTIAFFIRLWFLNNHIPTVLNSTLGLFDRRTNPCRKIQIAFHPDISSWLILELVTSCSRLID